MYHPTPYHSTTDGSLTHVFYDNYRPPSSGFGWSSLCNAVRLPIEGEHFEVNQDVKEENLTCRRCRERADMSYIEFDDDSIAGVNGCLVRFDRNENGVIVRAERICGGMLHYSLPFKPESFSGDLKEEVNNVCSECWETYVNHQWTGRDQGAEFCVKVWEDDSRSEYFAANAKTFQNGHKAALRLVSKNGLKKYITREQIESITLTPAQSINY